MLIIARGFMFFNNIQAIRGIASVMVFLIHLFSTSTDLQIPWVHQQLNIYGPGGVDIFFVLSGFVVTLSAMSGTGVGFELRRSASFLIKRVLRIYPPYLVVLFIAILISPPVWLAPDWLPQYSFIRLATLTTAINYKVMVAWSLAFEMFFYLVLTVVMFFGRDKFRAILFSWVIIEAIAIIYFNAMDKNYANLIPLNPQILQFAAGCIMACYSKEIKKEHGTIVLLSGVISFALMCKANEYMGGWNSFNRTLTLTIPSVMIIYGAVSCEISSKFVFHKSLVWLGNISFSMYLWHQLTFQSAEYLFTKLNIMSLNTYLILGIWASLGVATSCASYYLIEKKIAFLLKARKKTNKIDGRPVPL